MIGLGGLALAGACYSAGAFQTAREQTESRLFGRSTVIPSRAGTLEYAVAGNGPPVMMIHGTGGGFDQSLLFGAKLRQRGVVRLNRSDSFDIARLFSSALP